MIIVSCEMYESAIILLMKIFQLNVWGGRLGKQVIDLIKREDPDIVCLQEVVHIPGGDGFLIEDLEQILEATGFEYFSFNAQFGYNLMNRKARSGLAILSKYPFIEEDAVFTRLKYVDDFDIQDTDYNIRSLQRVSVVDEITGRNIHIINHHGHHVPNHKNGDEETLRQCQMIVNYIKNIGDPVILCGDFNLSPDSESLQLINRILINHAKEQGVITTRTPLTYKTEVCDYIFTSPGLRTQSFQVLDDIVSDHKALTLDFFVD